MKQLLAIALVLIGVECYSQTLITVSLPDDLLCLDSSSTMILAVYNCAGMDISIIAEGQILLMGQSGPHYYAPFIIVNNHVEHKYSNEMPSEIALAKGHIIEFKVNTADLKWANILSSQWPESAIGQVVLPGKYIMCVGLVNLDSSCSLVRVL